MKSSKAKKIPVAALAVACGALAVLAPDWRAELQAAVYGNHAGSICKNYSAYDAGKIDYLVSGARNVSPGATNLICPLNRVTTNAQGAVAYVDIKHLAAGTTSCSLYSYKHDGGLLGSSTVSWTGVGLYEIKLVLTGAGKSSSTSEYAVLCSIPGNANAVITSVDLAEN